jgi:RNAse (barnase) inhibitor barstar
MLCLLATTNANAGTITNNSWSPSGCGPAPVAPKVESSSLDAYNRSVTAVNQYRKNLRTFQDCLIQEANADLKIITKSANDAQLTTKEADDKILAEIKAADKKLGN